MKKKVGLSVFIGAIVLIILFMSGFTNIAIDIIWFDNIGYLSVFFKKFFSILKIMAPMFVVFYIIIWLYYKSIKNSMNRVKFIREVDVKKNKIEKRIFIAANAALSLLFSYSFAHKYWYKILEFINASDFNVKDPLYNKDISFFVFKLPLIESLHNTLTGIIIFMIVVTLVVFFISNASEWASKKSTDIKTIKNEFTKFAGIQLAVVAMIFILNMTLGFLIKSWNLVYSARGVVFGASYTDVKVTQKFYLIIAIVGVIVGIIVFISIVKKKYKLGVISVVILFALIPLEGITAGIVQKLVVDSNAIKLEKPYIEHNIDYTRKAYNLDSIDTVNFEIENTLTYADIEKNRDIIDNIKITSFQPTLEFYREVQYIKKYYTFNGVDVDRYMINGEYNQVFLAPREIDVNVQDESSNKWQNNHLVYTHGYGVVMNKVNELTEDRELVFVMDEIPQKNESDINLENPRIYFGEKTNQYVIVNTDVNELDYPKGDQNVSANYEGDAGIEMTALNKLIFALKEKEPKFLLSKDIKNNSKIIINRNIMDRVTKIAPFLSYDKDPYLFIDNGQLYWMIDAYTKSSRYPFSEKTNGINYSRNSIKVVIDAYRGDVKFYIVDENDPIAMTYSKIFPEMFETTVPQGIRSHFRYPSELFQLQSNILGKYHVTDPEIFIKNEDPWEIAKDNKKVEDQDNLTDPVYMVLKIPGEENVEMSLVNYFNVKDRANMVAMLAGRMDGENYGKMNLIKFPVRETVYSPTLFNQKVNQDVTISKELTLLDAKGSEVIYGDTLILPIKDSLLYVEPVYLRAMGGKSIPQVKFIILSYKDKIVKGESLEEALKNLFNFKEEIIVPDKEDKEDKEEITDKDNAEKSDEFKDLSEDKQILIKEANKIYDQSKEAMKNGEWAKYGELIEQLGKIIEKLNK